MQRQLLNWRKAHTWSNISRGRFKNWGLSICLLYLIFISKENCQTMKFWCYSWRMHQSSRVLIFYPLPTMVSFKTYFISTCWYMLKVMSQAKTRDTKTFFCCFQQKILKSTLLFPIKLLMPSSTLPDPSNLHYFIHITNVLLHLLQTFFKSLIMNFP